MDWNLICNIVVGIGVPAIGYIYGQLQKCREEIIVLRARLETAEKGLEKGDGRFEKLESSIASGLEKLGDKITQGNEKLFERMKEHCQAKSNSNNCQSTKTAQFERP